MRYWYGDDYYDNMMFGNYLTKKFTDIYNDVEKFIDDYANCGIPPLVDEDAARVIFYLLFAEYGNSNISNMDENQFKYRLFSTIFKFGPEWERRMRLQADLREMSDEELMHGTRTLYNQSSNPSQPVFTTDESNMIINEGTDTDIELPTINNQNTTKVRRGKVESYAILTSLLDDAGTTGFIERFKPLFIKIVQPYSPLWYSTPIEED